MKGSSPNAAFVEETVSLSLEQSDAETERGAAVLSAAAGGGAAAAASASGKTKTRKTYSEQQRQQENADFRSKIHERLQLHGETVIKRGETVGFRFNGHWGITFTLMNSPGREFPDPFLSPGVSGGILALRKKRFDELGLYGDVKLDEWGGDQVDATMKTWRCGGHVRNVPCARIAHLFRHKRPYEFSGWANEQNDHRLA